MIKKQKKEPSNEIKFIDQIDSTASKSQSSAFNETPVPKKGKTPSR